MSLTTDFCPLQFLIHEHTNNFILYAFWAEHAPVHPVDGSVVFLHSAEIRASSHFNSQKLSVACATFGQLTTLLNIMQDEVLSRRSHLYHPIWTRFVRVMRRDCLPLYHFGGSEIKKFMTSEITRKTSTDLSQKRTKDRLVAKCFATESK